MDWECLARPNCLELPELSADAAEFFHRSSRSAFTG